MDHAPQPKSEAWNSGTDLASFAWRVAGARGSVLLQHGFAEYSARYVAQYSQLVGRLNAANLDVYAMDLEGHGQSAGARRQLDVAESIAAHVEARKHLPDDRPVFLFGHSLGGAVTAGSVAKDGGNLAGVVLSGPALIKMPGLLVSVLDNLGSRFPRMPFKSLAPNAMTRSKEILAAVNEDPMMCRGWMPLGLIASLCHANLDFWHSGVRDWTVPTLIIHGSKDKYTQPRDSRRMYAQIQSADKTLHIVKNGFHETFNDPGGSEIAMEVVDWLETRARRSI